MFTLYLEAQNMHVFYSFSASFYPQLHHNGKGSTELFHPEEALYIACCAAPLT